MDRESLRGALAQSQHDIWSHWMKYQFSQCKTNANGDIIIPMDKYNRWRRQMNTPYEELSDKEKKSDLDMADIIINKLIEYNDQNNNR